MAASDIPDPRSVTDSREGTSAGPRASEDAQLYPQDGVSINVSSVAMDGGVLDRGLLNFAGASSSPRDTSSSGAISDADVMLRVKTGDESAFAYLVQKYRRPMVGFMHRMCRNPSTAE